MPNLGNIGGWNAVNHFQNILWSKSKIAGSVKVFFNYISIRIIERFKKCLHLFVLSHKSIPPKKPFSHSMGIQYHPIDRPSNQDALLFPMVFLHLIHKMGIEIGSLQVLIRF